MTGPEVKEIKRVSFGSSEDYAISVVFNRKSIEFLESQFDVIKSWLSFQKNKINNEDSK